jgi:hypothetical protein
MIRSTRLLIVWSAIVLSASPLAAQSPFPHPINIFVFSHPGSIAGPFQFDVTPFGALSAVAPDGTVFDSATPRIVGLTAEQLTARFAGTWTINNDPLAGQPPQQHQFSVAGERLTQDFAQVPVVISPNEGATVP